MKPVPLWVDCDPGIDDVLALMYLCGRRDVEWIGISTVHGNVDATRGATNALVALETARGPSVPVLIGVDRPLVHWSPVAEDEHGRNGLGDVVVVAPRQRPTAGLGPVQLARAAAACPGELVVLALGPLTNLAVALLIDPDLPRNVRELYIMGGAVHVPGNTTPAAEFNIWHDPEAAHVVLSAPWAATLVSLDVTEQALLEGEYWNALEAAQGAKARLAALMLARWVEARRIRTGRAAAGLHDPVAAAIALAPTLAEYETTPVRVDVSQGPDRGRTSAAPDSLGFPVRCATRLDRERFLADFMTQITSP